MIEKYKKSRRDDLAFTLLLFLEPIATELLSLQAGPSLKLYNFFTRRPATGRGQRAGTLCMPTYRTYIATFTSYLPDQQTNALSQ
jgi:hypothetical protein